MWRPAHGATSRPGPCRPASGYGRLSGRPGPCTAAAADDERPFHGLGPEGFDALAAFAWSVEGGDADVEVPAPLTP